MSCSEAVALDDVSFRYLDESEIAGQEREPSETGSRICGVSLDVAYGSCAVLCGRSGDGKSTVLRLIDGLAGTFFPGERKGAVLVGGTEVLDLSPRQRTEGMGVVMQDPRSQFFMGTVADEIAFSLENLGTEPGATVARVREAAVLCGVKELLSEKLTELSSGQKQRVAIARAMVNEPALILADEPTGALDSQTSRVVMDLFHEMHEKYHKTIVLITHNPALAEECQRVLTLRDGLIVGERKGTGERAAL